MTRALITSVRVREGTAHDILTVWARGGKAGELVVDRGDGIVVARRLLAPYEDYDHPDMWPWTELQVERGDMGPGSGLREWTLKVRS